jgi:hypothetical protein
MPGAGPGSPVKESHGALQHVNAASMCFCSHTYVDSCLAEMIRGAPLHRFPTAKYSTSVVILQRSGEGLDVVRLFSNAGAITTNREVFHGCCDERVRVGVL